MLSHFFRMQRYAIFVRISVQSTEMTLQHSCPLHSHYFFRGTARCLFVGYILVSPAPSASLHSPNSSLTNSLNSPDLLPWNPFSLHHQPVVTRADPTPLMLGPQPHSWKSSWVSCWPIYFPNPHLSVLCSSYIAFSDVHPLDWTNTRASTLCIFQCWLKGGGGGIDRGWRPQTWPMAPSAPATQEGGHPGHFGGHRGLRSVHLRACPTRGTAPRVPRPEGPSSPPPGRGGDGPARRRPRRRPPPPPRRLQSHLRAGAAGRAWPGAPPRPPAAAAAAQCAGTERQRAALRAVHNTWCLGPGRCRAEMGPGWESRS